MEQINDNARQQEESEVSSTIRRLNATLEQLRQEELRRFTKKLGPEEAGTLDELTTALVQNVLHSLTGQLKAARERGKTTPVLQVLTALFDLDGPAVAAIR